MGYVYNWLQDHHLLPAEKSMVWDRASDLLKTEWVIVLLTVAGIMALITAVLVSWPAVAYIGSRLFG